jgi:hypothetical protein
MAPASAAVPAAAVTTAVSSLDRHMHPAKRRQVALRQGNSVPTVGGLREVSHLQLHRMHTLRGPHTLRETVSLVAGWAVFEPPPCAWTTGGAATPRGSCATGYHPAHHAVDRHAPECGVLAPTQPGGRRSREGSPAGRHDDDTLDCHDDHNRNSGLTEIYLRFAIPMLILLSGHDDWQVDRAGAFCCWHVQRWSCGTESRSCGSIDSPKFNLVTPSYKVVCCCLALTACCLRASSVADLAAVAACSTALLQPRHPIGSVTRHDTGIVYMLLRRRGQTTKLSTLQNVFHTTIDGTSVGSRAKADDRERAYRHVTRRLQVALVELQTMGFVHVNATTCKKNSLAYADIC